MIPNAHLENGVRLIGSQKSKTKLIVIKSDAAAKGIIVSGLTDQTGFKGKILTLNELKKNELISYDHLIEGIGINSSNLTKARVGITSGDLLKGLKIPFVQISTPRVKHSSKKSKANAKKPKVKLSLRQKRN